jgi:transcriptional regulator with XRE-family HTH domain
MKSNAATDAALLEDLGRRLRRQRLLRNVTQRELADRTLLSLGTIKALEGGRGKLSTLVAVLRELGLLHELEHFVAPPAASPLELAERRRDRQRARPRRAPRDGGDGGES